MLPIFSMLAKRKPYIYCIALVFIVWLYILVRTSRKRVSHDNASSANPSRELIEIGAKKVGDGVVLPQAEDKNIISKVEANKTSNVTRNNELSDQITQAKQTLTYRLASEFYRGTDLYQTKSKQGLPFDEIIEYKNGKALKIDVGVRNKTTFNIGDQIPPSKARHILLLSGSGRSGSTFLGDLLSRYPGTFYSFEGERLKYPSNLKTKKVPDIVQQVFKCTPEIAYFDYEKYTWDQPWSHLEPNFRFSNVYKSFPHHDSSFYMKALYDATCPLFPIRLMKTILLPVEETEVLLNDPELSQTLKVIVLFRDPRGIMQSLTKMAEMRGEDWAKAANSPNTLCQKIESDALAAFKLKEKYPGRIHLVRYEDLCLKPHEVVKRLMHSLDLSSNALIKNFIDQHTQLEGTKEEDPYGTKRNSKHTAFKWIKFLKTGHISSIQKACSAPIKLLGYNLMTNIAADRKNNDFPILVKSANELWPENFQ